MIIIPMLNIVAVFFGIIKNTGKKHKDRKKKNSEMQKRSANHL